MFEFTALISMIAGIVILIVFVSLVGVLASEIVMKYETEKANKNINKEIAELITMVNGE